MVDMGKSLGIELTAQEDRIPKARGSQQLAVGSQVEILKHDTVQGSACLYVFDKSFYGLNFDTGVTFRGHQGDWRLFWTI
jgi:hypothetical protein